MNCFSCGREIEIIERVGFRETCKGCEADLHVCLNCSFFDENVHNKCRESSADPVHAKDRTNYCEYFRPADRAKALKDKDSAADAKAELDKLFKKS